MKNQKQIRVYRHRESIAIAFDDTETLYISAELAVLLSAKLREGARDIAGKDKTKFHESDFGSYTLEDKS